MIACAELQGELIPTTWLGVAAGLAIGRASESLLFQAKGNDPAVITGAALALSLVALIAGYIPAWRASRVNPVEALRRG